MPKGLALLAASVLAAGAVTFLDAGQAQACGGCFVPPGPSTQVSAHRMAFAISAKRTVLWDQIQYVGDPTEFGWVLPIRGKVDVGVSSDELFQRLETLTAPIVTQPPPPTCPEPTKRCRTMCNDFSGGGFADSASSASDGAFAPSVDVWSSSVVGPYEATQLSATDSSALKNWLKEHGYTLPDSIGPLIDSYIKEGFGFLAVKLVPNEAGDGRMVPIRIGFPGASPSLPLRMIAAGTGARVGIKLFVLGEGRWEAKNFKNAEVNFDNVVWDWAAMGSNYGQLEINLIDLHKGLAFISESSEDFARSVFFSGLPPGTTTTDTGSTVFSSITDQTEMDTAFPTRTNINVTRLFAELPSSALATDLELQAALGGKIPPVRQAKNSTNFFCVKEVEIDCPGISPICDGSPWGGPNGEASATGGAGGGGAFGCAASPPSSTGSSSSLRWLALGLATIGFVGVSARVRRSKGKK